MIFYLPFPKASMFRLPPALSPHGALWEDTPYMSLTFSALCPWERNCWVRWHTCTKFNSAEPVSSPKGCEHPGTLQDKPFSFSYLSVSACASSFQILASLLEAEWDLLLLTFNSLIINEREHFFHILLAFWVSPSCELSLHVLCLPAYCVFSFWFIGISCIF